jgi:hypothetical protein
MIQGDRAPRMPASVADLGPFPRVSFSGTIVAGSTELTPLTPIGDVVYGSAFSWSVTVRGDRPFNEWAAESLDGSAVARDGDVVTFYSARTNSTHTVAVRSGTVAPLFSPARLLTWNGTMGFSWARACSSGRVIGEEQVRGIQAVHIRCPGATMNLGAGDYTFKGNADVWVDPSTGIVLRIETTGPAPRPSELELPLSLTGPGARQRWELADLQIGGISSTAFTPPSDAIDATDQTVLTSVRLGQPMPRVELPLVDGGTTTLSGSPGTPTAIYFGSGSCFDAKCSILTWLDFLASWTKIDVIVVIPDSKWVDRELSSTDLPVPVAIDSDGVASALIIGLSGGDVLLLLDQNGNLAGAYTADFGHDSGGVLANILDAFAAGEPLPAHPGGQAQAQLP